MTDLRTIFIDMDQGADLALETFALASDDGLETAVILSLFTDARARDDDTLPAGQTDRRGWWADAFPAVAGDRFGSRLWLLRRSKQLQESLIVAREYAEEALAWLVEARGAAAARRWLAEEPALRSLLSLLPLAAVLLSSTGTARRRLGGTATLLAGAEREGATTAAAACERRGAGGSNSMV